MTDDNLFQVKKGDLYLSLKDFPKFEKKNKYTHVFRDEMVAWEFASDLNGEVIPYTKEQWLEDSKLYK